MSKTQLAGMPVRALDASRGGRVARSMVAAVMAVLVATTAQAQLTSAQLKCETAAGKALGKFTGSKNKCVTKCLSTQRKAASPAYGPCFPPYTDPTESACITGNLKGAQAKAGATIAKGCAALASCPACYPTAPSSACTDASGANPYVQFVEGLIDASVVNVYCDEQGGGTPSKTDAKCEDGLSKALVKFAGSKAKCYAKCQSAANKAGMSGSAFGCDPTATEPATVTCIGTATTKANASIDKACFTAPATHPACYDGSGPRPNTAAGWTALAEALIDATTQKVFCTTTTTTTTTTSTTTTTCPAAPLAIMGALPSTNGRFNFAAGIGLPGANAGCTAAFTCTHACTLEELESVPQSQLAGLKDTTNTAVTSFWAIDPSADPLEQCNDDVSSHLNWEYATAHTSSRGEKVDLNPDGSLGGLDATPPPNAKPDMAHMMLQCNSSGMAWVGCCR